MTTRNFTPRALGEIAIRCGDIAKMAEFYEHMIGLKRLSGGHKSDIVFFRISDGFQGHTAILALFQHSEDVRDVHPKATGAPHTGATSSLHHIALSLPYDEQQAVIDWYDQHNQPYSIQNFPWIGWRGIFTTDPEGNTVELVAYNADLLDAE